MIDAINILDKIDDYSRTIKGVAGLINDMQMSDGSGEYIYSEMRFMVLENILFDITKNMDELYKEIDTQRTTI